MKQLNFLKRKSLLFLGLMAMFLHSCQYDDFSHKEDNHQNKLNVKIEQKTLEQLMQDKNFVNAFDKVPKQKTPSLNSVVAKTVMEQDYDFIISEDIPAKVITTEEVISYTFHISRNGHFSDNSFENLVVLTDSLNTVSAYVIKYNLLSEPIYLNEHDSYIIDSEKEVIPISFNNSQARISVIGNDGCTVLTLMCPYDHPHPAGAGCIAEDRGDLYWVADSSGCGNGGGGSGSGNSGTPPGNGNSNGNQNGGGNGNGGTRSVSPIVTTPVGLDGVAIKDPCINAAQANQKSKNILNEPAFQQKLNQINGTIPTDTVEKGFTFGIRPEDNNFAVSEVQTGTATGINLPSTNPNFNVTGNIHTHPAIGFDSFSPSDFYGFTTANTANSNFSTMFVLGATGEVYSLTITDPVRFTNFTTFYPMTDHFDPAINGWKKGSPIRDDFMGAFDNLYREQGKTTDEAYALANAYVLRKYNAGMSISKKNSNGDFETLFVEEKKDPNDDTKTIYEQTSTCNLKKKN